LLAEDDDTVRNIVAAELRRDGFEVVEASSGGEMLLHIARTSGADNVVLTPHLGYVSLQNYQQYFPDIVEDIRGFLDGKPVRVIAAG
jgi:phosphoglycerate dehydrogenase-like enzyme